MIFDIWTEHQVRLYYLGAKETFTISGYNFVGLEDTTPTPPLQGGGFQYAMPQGVPENAWAGRNKWLDLLAKIGNKFSIDTGDFFLLWKKWRGRWACELYLNNDNVIFDSSSGFSVLNSTQYEMGVATEEEGTAWFSEFFHTYSGSRATIQNVFTKPVGLWQPCHMGCPALEPRDVVPNMRVAESPYDPRFRDVRNWGVRRTYQGIWDLVPASDIYDYRAIDIPHKGWAKKARRTAGYGMGSTLEYIWTWAAKATPQHTDDGQFAPPDVGHPIVCVWDEDVLGNAGLIRETLPGVNPDSIDTSWRHFVFDGTPSMQSALTVREGSNRRYRVAWPLVDVTMPSMTLAPERIFRR